MTLSQSSTVSITIQFDMVFVVFQFHILPLSGAPVPSVSIFTDKSVGTELGTAQVGRAPCYVKSSKGLFMNFPLFCEW